MPDGAWLACTSPRTNHTGLRRPSLQDLTLACAGKKSYDFFLPRLQDFYNFTIGWTTLARLAARCYCRRHPALPPTGAKNDACCRSTEKDPSVSVHGTAQ